MESSEPLLEVRNASVRYGRVEALRNVSYRIAPGAVVCLLGGNASGKSTSMKAILGTVRLAAGEVFWKGQPLTGMATAARIKAGLGAVPEGKRIFSRLTVEENLLVGAATRRDKSQIRADVTAMYELFPRLGERSHQQGGKLSGGEQQMLSLARGLMSRPVLLLMDEPSMGLSPLLVRQNFALISRLRERGTAVFIIEQNAKAALGVAEYAYVLRGGEVALEGPADEVARHPMMVEAYLGTAPSGLRVGGPGSP